MPLVVDTIGAVSGSYDPQQPPPRTRRQEYVPPHKTVTFSTEYTVPCPFRLFRWDVEPESIERFRIMSVRVQGKELLPEAPPEGFGVKEAQMLILNSDIRIWNTKADVRITVHNNSDEPWIFVSSFRGHTIR